MRLCPHYRRCDWSRSPVALFSRSKSWFSRSKSWFVTLLQFLRPHHVLRPRDRYRTITPLLLVGVLPEPVHAARSDAEISSITQFARVPGKELPQQAPFRPVPVCPSPTLADLHDAHPHSGFVRRQHSAHVENPPVPRDATSRLANSNGERVGQSWVESLTACYRSLGMLNFLQLQLEPDAARRSLLDLAHRNISLRCGI